MTMTDDFLEMRAAFVAVVPIKRGGKLPDSTMSRRQRGTTAWKNDPNSYYNRLTMRDEVREWADEGLGIGMIAGRLGIVALDIDVPDLFLPLLDGLSGVRTATAQSPGGFHVYFKTAPGMGNQDFSCPLFNDPTSPCYCERHHLASLRVDDSIAVLPHTEGRKWLLPPREVGFAEMPEGLLNLCESFGKIARQRRQAPRPEAGIQLPEIVRTPIEGAVLLDDVNPALRTLITAPNSPLIPALVSDLGGVGSNVPCPYHGPDQNPSASFWLGNRGWYLKDHHKSPPDSVLLSQFACDRFTGYLDRLDAGEQNPHRHLVSRQSGNIRKSLRGSWPWLAILAEDVGAIELPASRLPNRLDGFTPEGLMVMRFIGLWERGYRYTFGLDFFPLARTWLISILFALPSPRGEKSPEWIIAYREIDKTIWHSLQQKILVRVAKGKVGAGGMATLYRIRGEGGGDKA